MRMAENNEGSAIISYIDSSWDTGQKYALAGTLEEVQELLGNGLKDVVLDLKGVKRFATDDLKEIIEVYRLLRGYEVRLRLINVERHPIKMLRLMGFAKLSGLEASSLDEAVAKASQQLYS
jgi:anti-anti-sigma regulatory factor